MRSWQGHRLMLPGRLVALALLAMALAQPASENPRNAMLAVLVDHSPSVSPAGVEAAERRLAVELKGLDNRVTIDARRFGAAPAETGLRDALANVVRGMPPNAGNAVLVASHGYWPQDSIPLLERIADAGIGVYWLPVDAATKPPAITGIAAPPVAQPGQRVAVVVSATPPLDTGHSVVLYANRQRAAAVPASARGETTVFVTLPDSGTAWLSAELVRSDTGETVARLDDGAVINIASTPRLLLASSGRSVLGESLAAGGWPVTRVSAAGLAALAPNLEPFDALILDDVPADAVPDSAWRAVAVAVREGALGLLALGGPNSFALGAYRHSVLEDLLPLVSEPPASEQPASVVFLIDVSGSMGRGETDTLRIARDAVLETTKSLRVVDRIGLVAFDVEARPLLPVAGRDDHARAMREAWPDSASGGTSLMPAIDQGLDALSRETTEQKILVAVTDGLLSDEDMAQLEQRLAASDVEFIGLVIGSGSAADRLESIAASERATVLLIDNVLRLPALMRGELEERRPAVVIGRTNPVRKEPMPFGPDTGDWPAIDAYLVARPKPSAAVQLASDRRDPLVASWTAGAGRVVAVTPGLGEWARAWTSWAHWPAICAGLAGYVASQSATRVRPGPEAGFLDIDTAFGGPSGMSVAGIGNGVQALEAVPVAPGRFRARTAVTEPGTYTLAWVEGGSVKRFSFALLPVEKAQTEGEQLARRFVEQGLVREWTVASVIELEPPTSGRTLLTAIALVAFLLTLAGERLPVPSRSGARAQSRRHEFRGPTGTLGTPFRANDNTLLGSKAFKAN